MLARRLQVVGIRRIQGCGHAQRNPAVAIIARENSAEMRRRYTHHCERVPVQKHFCVHRSETSAKMVLPERVTQHDHRIRASVSFIRRLQQPACRWMKAQHLKELPAYQVQADLLRPAAAGKPCGSPSARGDPIEYLVARAKLPKQWIGKHRFVMIAAGTARMRP